MKLWELDPSLPIEDRAGQAWRSGTSDAAIVVVVGKLVPDWGPGYESGVHSCVYLSAGTLCYLTEAELTTHWERLS